MRAPAVTTDSELPGKARKTPQRNPAQRSPKRKALVAESGHHAGGKQREETGGRRPRRKTLRGAAASQRGSAAPSCRQNYRVEAAQRQVGLALISAFVVFSVCTRPAPPPPHHAEITAPCVFH